MKRYEQLLLVQEDPKIRKLEDKASTELAKNIVEFREVLEEQEKAVREKTAETIRTERVNWHLHYATAQRMLVKDVFGTRVMLIGEYKANEELEKKGLR